ncbi:MAG: hypothetical protein IRZ18_03300 [Clostridia bacterium]|nr:hypothetical protein [Clostridia bacterium]
MERRRSPLPLARLAAAGILRQGGEAMQVTISIPVVVVLVVALAYVYVKNR